jgi:acyl phosphate:glycerol-3-phosphate acyltransferase
MDLWLNFQWLCGIFTLAYLLGSIPFGMLLARLAGLGDVRKIGSGNIGATNVLRAGKKWVAALTLILDMLKGIAAVLLAQYIYNDMAGYCAGFFVVIGHAFPVWLRFRGGKGVATTIGVIFALDWPLGVIVCLIWLTTFYFMRISSLASLISIGYSIIVAHLMEDEKTAALCLFLAAFIVFTHRGNINRLLQGTEHIFKKNNDRYNP